MLKSSATSASASAAGRSLVMGRFAFPMPANCPASRPSARLSVEAIAPVISSCGKPGAARMSACPMRPLTPMITARVSGGWCGRALIIFCSVLAGSALAGSGGEKAPHALEEALLARSVAARLRLERLLEPANQLTLLRREVHGGLHRNAAEKVSPRPAAHGLYAFVP